MNKYILLLVLAVCGYWTMRVVNAPGADEDKRADIWSVDSGRLEQMHAMDVEEFND